METHKVMCLLIGVKILHQYLKSRVVNEGIENLAGGSSSTGGATSMVKSRIEEFKIIGFIPISNS